MLKKVSIAAAAVLLTLNFLNIEINATDYTTPAFDKKEKFDPSLSRIRTIDRLEKYTDSIASASNTKENSIAYVTILQDAVSRRFYHGFSHLTFKENWVAALSEKIFGYGLSCKVLPNDILKNEEAACSQQSIVMMTILKRKGIAYRKVGFSHHFALEANVNGQWDYFDPNMEPKIASNDRAQSSWQGKADRLKPYYDARRYNDLDYKFGNEQLVTFGVTNGTPAPILSVFQKVTFLISKLLWCVPLLIMAFKTNLSFSKSKAFQFNFKRFLFPRPVFSA